MSQTPRARKPTNSKTSATDKWYNNTAVVAILAAILGALATQLFSSQTLSWFRSRLPTDHEYVFKFDGQELKGRSRSTFLRGDGYEARVEVCHLIMGQLNGAGKSVVECFITFRALKSIVVTNAPNSTSAIFTDGSAAVCCIRIDGIGPIPIAAAGLPYNLTHRKTLAPGDEAQIAVSIQDVEGRTKLDSISFSPGGDTDVTPIPVEEDLVLITGAIFSPAH